MTTAQTPSTGPGGMLPAIGARVYTADGADLGKVKDLAGSCFKVDAAMQPDYWLATDCVATSGAGEVRLTFPKDRLGDAKIDGPDHSGVHRHTDGPTVNYSPAAGGAWPHHLPTAAHCTEVRQMPVEPSSEPAQDLGLGERVAVGWSVFTKDGEDLGTVKEVRGGYFKVDAARHPDYWLQAQAVHASADGRITLEFVQELLDDYKVEQMPEPPLG
jgi:hypothetical protein